MTVIAVTGATGQLGGRVARRLAADGATQRLIVRDVHRAPRLAGAELRGPSTATHGPCAWRWRGPTRS